MSFGEVYDRVLTEYPDILTVEDMSKALGVSTKTGYKLLQEKRVLCLRVGRSYRIPKAHLLAYLRLGSDSLCDF